MNKILVLIIIFLAFIITTTTIVAKKAQKKPVTVSAVTALSAFEKNTDEYKGLGTIRCATKKNAKKNKEALVVVVPILSYQKGDREFLEELSRKNQELKAVFSDYFINYTIEELYKIPEQIIKTQLKESLNANLTLNKIIDLYFTAFSIIE